MQKNVNPVDKNSPEYLLKQIAGGRYSLLLILIFTVVNLVLLLVDSDRYFLFSASVPYISRRSESEWTAPSPAASEPSPSPPW